jgi:WD40 repeat protein
VTFSPDGKTIASGGKDHMVRLWDIENEKCLGILPGTDWVWSVAFSPDGKTLASGGDDHMVRFWDIESGKCFRTLQVHANTVWSVAFSPDGMTIASGSEDQTIRLWDSSNGDCMRTLQGYRNAMTSVAFSPDGKVLASGSEDRTVRLWDIEGGRCENLPAFVDRIWSLAFNADGTMLASSAVEVGLWDMRGKRWAKIFPHPTWVYSVAFSPDGRLLATCDDDGTTRLWNISSNSNQPARIFQEGTNSCWSVALSSVDNIIAAAGDDVIRIWDIESGKRLRSLQDHTKTVLSIAISPDGTTLVSGSEDCTVRIWLAHTGSRIKILEGHTGSVNTVAFSRDGKQVASGSQDTTIRLWNTQASEEPPKVLEGHEDIVWRVAFHPHGNILASASEDGTIRLWSTQTGMCFRVLRIDRPYEGMNITGITGLTHAQKVTLRALGAIEDEDRPLSTTETLKSNRDNGVEIGNITMDKKPKIFCCYAHEDHPLLLKLRKHLAALEREGLITVWHDADISAGTKWEEEINKHLDTANIVLLLVSPDFIASEYCYSKEMKRAMERHKQGKTLVIPLILRPVAWLETPFGQLQALPVDAKPITEWPNHDRAFTSVIKGIRKVIAEVTTNSIV